MRAIVLNVLKIFASLALSLLAGYLALRGVDLKEVLASIHQADLTAIALVLVLIATAQLVRSLRWGFLLRPLQSVSQRVLLPITCIGFLFVWILPARLGETVRPYLLRQNWSLGLSPAVGSVVLERLIDAGFLTALMAVCLPALELPSQLLSALRVFVCVLVAIALFLLLGSKQSFRGRFLQVVSRLLPESLSKSLKRLVEAFYSGMQAVTSLLGLLVILALTLLIWGAVVAAHMVLFQSMELQLGWLAAVTVLVVTCLGIALPAAPGFVGNYHYACLIALTLLGVVKETALAFALLIHFLTVAVVILMGLCFMNTSQLKVGFSLKRKEFIGDNQLE